MENRIDNLLGPDYPLRVDDSKLTVQARGLALAKSWLEQFLLSSPGCRPHRHEWGAGLSSLLFGMSDEATAALIQNRVKQAERLMPIVIDTVEASRVGDGDQFRIVIDFHIVGQSQVSATLEVLQ